MHDGPLTTTHPSLHNSCPVQHVIDTAFFCWRQQVASQGDDDYSPRHEGGNGNASFAIGVAAGDAAIARAQGQSAQQPGRPPAPTATGDASSPHAAAGAAAAPQQPLPWPPSPRRGGAPQQPRPKPNFWAPPTVRLADFTSQRSGVHQEDITQDELLPEVPDETGQRRAAPPAANQGQGGRR